MFNFHCGGLSPSTGFFGGHLLEEVDGNWIPASERFDDEGLEEDALSLAMLKMHATSEKIKFAAKKKCSLD